MVFVLERVFISIPVPQDRFTFSRSEGGATSTFLWNICSIFVRDRWYPKTLWGVSSFQPSTLHRICLDLHSSRPHVMMWKISSYTGIQVGPEEKDRHKNLQIRNIAWNKFAEQGTVSLRVPRSTHLFRPQWHNCERKLWSMANCFLSTIHIFPEIQTSTLLILLYELFLQYNILIDFSQHSIFCGLTFFQQCTLKVLRLTWPRFSNSSILNRCSS